jgi:ABC-type molybdate transport system substrate-binding protein
MVCAMRYAACTLMLAALAIPLAAADVSTLATAAAKGPLQALEKLYQQPGQAVVMSKSAAPDAAGTFVRAIVTPAARQVFAAAGWEF